MSDEEQERFILVQFRGEKKADYCGHPCRLTAIPLSYRTSRTGH